MRDKRRLPNPWIAVPALAMGLLAGALGWLVTDASCRTSSATGAGCPWWGMLVAGLSFVGATIGMTILLALVYRSLAEWKQKTG